MKHICLLQVGDDSDSVIANLASTLNAIQSEFEFSLDPLHVIHISEKDPGNRISDEKLMMVVQKYLDKKHISDYGIALCNFPLKDFIVTSSDYKKAIISTQGWEVSFSRYSILKIITYGLIDILLESLGIPTLTHYDSKACPMDYLMGKKDILNTGLEKADFCIECRSLILSHVAHGRITLGQLAAIYKMLDFVAGRKSCFVLMPFADSFNDVYKHSIHAAVTTSAWKCTRADEIHQPREIIDQIWEQILRADLIIADLTGRNPNVFYELGYAHALNKNTILITQSIDDVPFDLRHRRLVCYSQTAKGYKELFDSIRRYME